MLGIIGGSGLSELANMQVTRRRAVGTPYGKPSGALVIGTLRGRKVVFLPRHGPAHTIPPHEVNYRANIWALHAQKVKDVVSVASVGGIRASIFNAFPKEGVEALVAFMKGFQQKNG